MTGKRLRTSILGIFLLCSALLPAQFYNGHQMTFGKNRVQYNGFYWSYKRYGRFDTYFNEYGKAIADYVAEYASKELVRMEQMFDYNLDQRIIFVVYNKLSDFRQSNIGLVTGKADNNIGGITQIDRNKVFLYFEGDYHKLDEQISATIARVLISEMIYGVDLRQNVASSTLINLPDWYIEGLVAYLSKGWDFETENFVKDGILSGKYKKFSRLIDEDARYAGHSFWHYIAQVYGESVIPSILYLTKVNKNANVGFLYVVGAPLKELSRDWNAYYRDLYSGFESKTRPTSGQLLKRPRRHRTYQQVSVNPLGRYVAYVTNQMGQYKVWLYNTETGKKERIFKKEHKLEQITDYSYPVLAWHPSGRTLTFITEEEGGLKMYYYTFGEKQLKVRNMLYYEKILDYSFSHDGTLMVLSAVRNGQSDIYVHTIAAGSNFQVTNDRANDFDPRFINKSNQIIFSSDRRSDSLSAAAIDTKTSFTRELFIYDYANRSDMLMRLSDDYYVSKASAHEVGRNEFISLSDKNGIVNRYYSAFDSTISYVDTLVHYRYIAHTAPLTDYPRSIVEQDYNANANKYAEVVYQDGRYYMYARPYEQEIPLDHNLELTPFRQKHTQRLMLRDSLQAIHLEYVPIDSVVNGRLIYASDTVQFEYQDVDINNYTFEIERINLYNSKLSDEGYHLRIVEKIEDEEKKVRIYQPSFYQNYIVSQIDFGFLSESYQAFTGGAVYFNPGANALMKVGTHDLFEDYKVTAGIRIPLDFESSEYLISFENLKKRWDKQYVYHRQAFKHFGGDESTLYIKTLTNELSAIYRYPFSQVTSVVFTGTLRNDRNVYLYDITGQQSRMQEALNQSDDFRLWSRAKAEYIFDNTRSLGINLMGGTRFKLFTEFYQQVNGRYDNLVVLGGDFRHYTVLHRNLILANRFAASSSFGSSRLIYYLGGVDNWTNVTPSKHPTFIPLSEIRIDENVNYAYQAVATNMRGFSQNIRNGNNFAVINSEIRWPIISYLVNHPLSNAFIENLQAVGFFDIGTAWSGLHPWARKNAYDNDIIQQPPNITIEIDSNRNPVVAGYGFGVRSQLFGYFIRLDWAWGIDDLQVLPRIFYLSLNLDF